MPLHLEPIDVSAQLDGIESVLIVSCPICPPASLATDKGSPLIDFFRHGIKTVAFEDYLRKLRQSLDERGIRTGVFTSYLPCPATCLWTEGQRIRLLSRAKDYDAAVVMGCESATCTVETALKHAHCRVISGMQLVGITNAKLKFEFPFKVTLENLTKVHAKERVEEVSSSKIR